MIFWIFAGLSVPAAAWWGLAAGWQETGAGMLWRFPAAALAVLAGLLMAFAVVTAVSAAVVDTKKPCETVSPYYRWLTDQIMGLCVILGRIRITATGMERVPKGKRYLLVCNHLNDLDPVPILRVFRGQELTFISKKENERLPVVGPVMHKLMCLSIDRENDRAALRTILKAVTYLKEDKISVAVFPEGYTSRDGQLQGFRNGVFKIAQKAEAPIVVAVLTNTEQFRENLFRRTTRVSLDVLGVLEPEEIKGAATKDVGDRIHAMMERGIAERKKPAEGRDV